MDLLLSHSRILLIKMCLAIPAKIISIKENLAQVDFSEGVLREVNVSLVNAKVGEYVLVHAGYAIQLMDEKDALETLSLWNEILASQKEQERVGETGLKNYGS